MPYGLFNLTWGGYLLYTLITTLITIISITIFFHRYQAHRSLALHPIISHIFSFWIWLTTGIKTKNWGSVHRKYHANCDTQNDPHSPQWLGLKSGLPESEKLYQKKASNADTSKNYASQAKNSDIKV